MSMCAQVLCNLAKSTGVEDVMSEYLRDYTLTAGSNDVCPV